MSNQCCAPLQSLQGGHSGQINGSTTFLSVSFPIHRFLIGALVSFLSDRNALTRIINDVESLGMHAFWIGSTPQPRFHLNPRSTGSAPQPTHTQASKGCSRRSSRRSSRRTSWRRRSNNSSRCVGASVDRNRMLERHDDDVDDDTRIPGVVNPSTDGACCCGPRSNLWGPAASVDRSIEIIISHCCCAFVPHPGLGYPSPRSPKSIPPLSNTRDSPRPPRPRPAPSPAPAARAQRAALRRAPAGAAGRSPRFRR